MRLDWNLIGRIMMKNRCKCFLRSTSNADSKTGQKQVSLPPKIWKQMDWKLNENLTIDIIKNGMVHNITITKDETDYDNR